MSWIKPRTQLTIRDGFAFQMRTKLLRATGATIRHAPANAVSHGNRRNLPSLMASAAKPGCRCSTIPQLPPQPPKVRLPNPRARGIRPLSPLMESSGRPRSSVVPLVPDERLSGVVGTDWCSFWCKGASNGQESTDALTNQPCGEARFAPSDSGGAPSAHHRGPRRYERLHPTGSDDDNCRPPPTDAALSKLHGRSNQERAPPAVHGTRSYHFCRSEPYAWVTTYGGTAIGKPAMRWRDSLYAATPDA